MKLIISIPFLTFNSIDLDEPFSIFHAQNSFSGLFHIFQSENNPPAHFVLLHFWEQLFGIGPISVRSLSLLFSVLTIIVIWKIGQRFFNEKSAIIVSLLFIFSDFHHYHGIEARTYSLLVLEFSILLYLLFKILFEKELSTWKDYFLLGLINVLLFYTHYISPFIFLSELILLLVYFKQFQLKNSLISLLIFVIGVFPWINVLLSRVDSVKTSGTWLSKAQFSELYGLINKFFNDKWAFLGLIIFIGALVILNKLQILKLVREKKNHFIVLLLLFLIPYLSSFFLSRFGLVDIFYDRYLFFLTIPLFFLTSMFFQTQDNLKTISFIGFFIIFLLRFDYLPKNERNGNDLASYVKKLHAPNIVIAPDYYDLTFLYHYDQELFKDISIRGHLNEYGIYAIKETTDLTNYSFSGSIVLIDIDFEFTHPGQSIKKWFIENGYNLIKSKRFKGNYKVYLFEK